MPVRAILGTLHLCVSRRQGAQEAQAFPPVAKLEPQAPGGEFLLLEQEAARDRPGEPENRPSRRLIRGLVVQAVQA